MEEVLDAAMAHFYEGRAVPTAFLARATAQRLRAEQIRNDGLAAENVRLRLRVKFLDALTVELAFELYRVIDSRAILRGHAL